MRLILKTTEDMGFAQTMLDVDIHSTIDHVIAGLTMRFNTIDATKITISYKGKPLPYEGEVLSLGLFDECELDVRYKRSNCCSLI